ncbi:hypothetical protein DL95DRAFT_463121 [Leptodontidium sp. 2 PMI_412]|nr:hypothetical protein DL95DRAFT_463121 [Leptodontidium sp. 2 PMI_412]
MPFQTDHLAGQSQASDLTAPATKLLPLHGVVDPSNAVLFGLNSNSPANKRDHLSYLFNENYRVITSSAVALDSAGRATEALRWLEERVDYILVHLDVDVIDPGLFPLGDVPNWSGVKFPEIMTAMSISGTDDCGGQS